MTSDTGSSFALFAIHPTSHYDVSRSAQQSITTLFRSNQFSFAHAVHTLEGSPENRYVRTEHYSLSEKGSVPEMELARLGKPTHVTVVGGHLNQCFMAGVRSVLSAYPDIQELVFPLRGIYLDLLFVGKDHTYAGIPLDTAHLRWTDRRERTDELECYTATLEKLIQSSLDRSAIENLFKDHLNKDIGRPMAFEARFEKRFGQPCLVHRPLSEIDQVYNPTLSY